MSTTLPSPLHDDELIQMLARDPELLAIADALVATRRGARARLSRRLPRRTGVAAAVAALAAIALMLVSPWQARTAVVDRALAAVGDQPVLHVVFLQPQGSGESLVDVDTGKTMPRSVETEIWFDSTRELEKTVTSIDGKPFDEMLQTEKGGWTQRGPVFTCAWIAAHPVEATKAGVSCNASGDNGTTPRTLPEQPPTLDPALAEFVDHYQSALQSGQARETGSGTLEGREVVWLEFVDTNASERVAVDADSYLPVLVEHELGGNRYEVATIETVPYEPSLFSKPQAVVAASSGVLVSEADATPEEAAAALGGTALWLGREWNGFELIRTSRQRLKIGYGALSDHPPTWAEGIELTYAPVTAGGAVDVHRKILIREATACVVAYGWTCSPRDPSREGLLLWRGRPISVVRRHGLYVAIWNWSEPQVPPVEIVRRLQPLAGD